jgi:hypothetical protein
MQKHFSQRLSIVCLHASEKDELVIWAARKEEKNISKYQTYTKQQQQKSANKRKKNFLLRFFFRFLSFLLDDRAKEPRGISDNHGVRLRKRKK